MSSCGGGRQYTAASTRHGSKLHIPNHRFLCNVGHPPAHLCQVLVAPVLADAVHAADLAQRAQQWQSGEAGGGGVAEQGQGQLRNWNAVYRGSSGVPPKAHSWPQLTTRRSLPPPPSSQKRLKWRPSVSRPLSSLQRTGGRGRGGQSGVPAAAVGSRLCAQIVADHFQIRQLHSLCHAAPITHRTPDQARASKPAGRAHTGSSGLSSCFFSSADSSSSLRSRAADGRRCR